MSESKPVTLADLYGNHKLAWVYCNTCGRERDVPPAALGLPLDTPVPDAGKPPNVSLDKAAGRRSLS
jgi:hypothetical protein